MDDDDDDDDDDDNGRRMMMMMMIMIMGMMMMMMMMTTCVLDFQILLISFAKSCYFSHFSVSFCSRLLSPGTDMSTMIVSLAFFFSELQCLASCGEFHGLFGW